MDMSAIVKNILSSVLGFVQTVFGVVLGAGAFVVLVFFLGFFLWYRVNPFRPSVDRLSRLDIVFRPYDLLRWLWWDFLTRKERTHEFNLCGFTIFVGRQGSGKTVSMVQYLETQRQRFPKCKIITNFSYVNATERMESWRDLIEIRNGTNGVIFAIDEIHSEYSSADWKDFPESLLSEISQQRKQRVKIVATSQVFSRIAKPIREQAFSVVACSTYFGRLTFNKEYDAAEYATSDTPYRVKQRVKPVWKHWFVQSNYLRGCYDTYEKIKRMEGIDFIPRGERF